jgi:hypothetical protein
MDAKLEFKCLKRYLKECNVYSPFFRYVKMEELRNITRLGNPAYEGLDTIGVLSVAIMKSDMVYIRNIISAMIVWDKTKEGYEFWSSINRGYVTFRAEYLKKAKNEK